jgi:predicted dehydrogenase
MNKIKLGILGTGYIATKMAEAVKYLENQSMGIEAYAIASRNKIKADQFAEEHHFQKAYGSYEDLVNDPNVHLIYIATPHSEHFENAKLCIEKGKAVLVEKAFTSNAKQASILISLAEEKGVLLVEAMWTRFLPAIKIIKDWITAGRIGEVKLIEADFSQPISHIERLQNPSLAGGALLDLGIYCLTFADLFLEGNIISTQSHCIPFKTGVDASDWITLTYSSGQKAFLKTSMVTPPKNEGILYGSKGYIRVENLNNMVRLELLDHTSQLLETIVPPMLMNGYEYQLLACKKALEAKPRIEGNRKIWECEEMPHSKTLSMMEQLDSLRDSFGVTYPFEIPNSKIWDRSKNKSILQIYNIETKECIRLKEFDYVIEAPNWSTNGDFLTYNSNGKIFKYDITTATITEVPSYYIDQCNNDHVLAPDGSGLYVSHHTKEDGLSRIYRIFFDGRKPILITPLGPSYLHGVSPDGKTLAYCAARNGEYDIYTIPSEGGDETQLTSTKGLNDGPEYDSTGEYIWFNSVRTGRMQAYRMKANGEEQTQITDDLHWNTWFPHISPDKKHAVMIAYHENDVKPGEHVPNKNVEIRLIKEEGNQWSSPETILKLFGGQGSINVNSWAPDSKRFAFVSYL